jgi:hypothetical protein
LPTGSPPPTPSFHDIPTQGDMNIEFGHHKPDSEKLIDKLLKAEPKTAPAGMKEGEE